MAIDGAIYGLRNRIECCFNRRKNARRDATRYDKLADTFLAVGLLVAVRLWRWHFVIAIGRQSLDQHGSSQGLNDANGIDPSGDPDRQGFAGEDVDQRHQPQATAIVGLGLDKIEAPEMVATLRPQADTGPSLSQSLALLDCFWGTFSPSRRQMCWTRSLPTSMPLPFRVTVLATAMFSVAYLTHDLLDLVITRFVVTAILIPPVRIAAEQRIGVKLRYYGAACWRPFAAGGVMALAAWSMNETLSATGSVRLGLDIFLGAVVYVGTLLSLWIISGRPASAEGDVIPLIERGQAMLGAIRARVLKTAQ